MTIHGLLPSSGHVRSPARGRARTIGRGIVAAVLVLGAVLLCAELTLRLFGYGNYERYLPDKELLWVLEPGQHTITHFGHRPVSVNSHGMRAPEFAVPKPAGRIRIICFGDSYTYGYGVGQEETYPAQLGRLLEARFPGRYEVLNAGVNGYGTFQELYALKRALRYQPDVVIVSSTYNDDVLIKNVHVVDGVARMPEAESDRVQRGVRLKRLARSFALYNFGMERLAQGVYRRVKDRLVVGTWSTQLPDNSDMQKFEPIVRDIVRTAREGGAKVVFLIPHRGELGPYGAVIARTATAAGIPYVAMGKVFAAYPDQQIFYVEHGHPNDFGQGLVARQLLDAVLSVAPAPDGGR